MKRSLYDHLLNWKTGKNRKSLYAIGNFDRLKPGKA